MYHLLPLPGPCGIVAMGRSGKILSFGGVAEFLILSMASFHVKGWLERWSGIWTGTLCLLCFYRINQLFTFRQLSPIDTTFTPLRMSNPSANSALTLSTVQYEVSKPVTPAQMSALELVFTKDGKKTAKFLHDKGTEERSPDNKNPNLSLNVQELWQSLYEEEAKIANKKSRRSRLSTGAENTAAPQSQGPEQAADTIHAPSADNHSNNNDDASTQG